MDTPKHKFILLKQDRLFIRCRIENIVCIISTNGICKIYEHHPDLERVIVVHSHYRLAWFTNKITDPLFFTTKQGTVLNTRFFMSMDADRNIGVTVQDIPQLVVAADRLSEFKKHLTEL